MATEGWERLSNRGKIRPKKNQASVLLFWLRKSACLKFSNPRSFVPSSSEEAWAAIFSSLFVFLSVLHWKNASRIFRSSLDKGLLDDIARHRNQIRYKPCHEVLMITFLGQELCGYNISILVLQHFQIASIFSTHLWHSKIVVMATVTLVKICSACFRSIAGIQPCSPKMAILKNWRDLLVHILSLQQVTAIHSPHHIRKFSILDKPECHLETLCMLQLLTMHLCKNIKLVSEQNGNGGGGKRKKDEK